MWFVNVCVCVFVSLCLFVCGECVCGVGVFVCVVCACVACVWYVFEVCVLCVVSVW